MLAATATTVAAHTESSGFPLLTALIVSPLIGAVITLIMPSRRPSTPASSATSPPP